MSRFGFMSPRGVSTTSFIECLGRGIRYEHFTRQWKKVIAVLCSSCISVSESHKIA